MPYRGPRDRRCRAAFGEQGPSGGVRAVISSAYARRSTNKSVSQFQFGKHRSLWYQRYLQLTKVTCDLSPSHRHNRSVSLAPWPLCARPAKCGSSAVRTRKLKLILLTVIDSRNESSRRRQPGCPAAARAQAARRWLILLVLLVGMAFGGALARSQESTRGRQIARKSADQQRALLFVQRRGIGLSRSARPRPSVPANALMRARAQHAAMLRELRRMFEERAEDGRAAFEYKTRVYFGRLAE